MKCFSTKSRGLSAVEIAQLRSFRWFVPYLAIILLFLFFPSAAHAQQKIAGKVTSASETLIGATIVVKGSPAKAQTDANGRFSILAASDAVLVVSSIGFETVEYPVNNRTTLTILLKESSQQMQEVVVVGYGTQKKVNLTGSVASVSGKELTKRPVTNAGSMLQGLMPGVQVKQGTGEPGNEGLSIRIRGTGTFSGAGSNPLVLIDGVEGNLSDLNPSNIESVSVLKDAASASIYGARAANGVILVTTKMGTEGKLNIEYSGNYAIHEPTKMFNLITNSAEYMELFNEAKLNSGLTSGLYPQTTIDLYRNATDRNQYPNTDWLSLIFKPAPTQIHNLTFNGGKGGTKFNVSLGYVDETGSMKGFDYQRYNARFNITSQINEKIKFGANVALKNGERSGPRQGSEDLFIAAMAQAPTYSPQLANGSGLYSFKAYDFESNNKNPIAIIDNKVYKNTDDYAANSQLWLEVQLLKGLSWYTKGAFNATFSKYNDFRPQIPLHNFQTNQFMTLLDVGGAGLEVGDEQNIYTNLYSYLNYDHAFNNGHNFKVQAGYSMEDNTWQYLRGYRKNYPSDLLRQLDAGSPSVQNTGGTQQEWGIRSYFSRLNYNYKERYLVEANLRYDGTSRLSPDSRWGAFPSFSAGWRVTEEQFIKNLDLTWLNNLKIRGSYGQLGNQNIGIYPYQAILSLTGNYPFDDSGLSSGVAQTTLSNPNIKWETTTISDVGLDLTAFGGLTLTADWYKKRTTDILRISQVTDIVGLGAPTINNGTMDNTGVELGITYNHTVKAGLFNGLNYNMGFNIDHYKNKVVKFGKKEISGYRIREEGQEWDSYYMLEWTGIFQNQAEIDNSPKQFTDATVPGDLKFKDQNGDGKINNDDRIEMSGNFPGLNYAFNFAANWKGFDFSILMQGVENIKFFVNNWGTIPFVQGSPPTTDWRERWTENNPSTTMPRIYWGWGAPERIQRPSSWYLQDASYLRLKNLTFGYTVPTNVTKRLGIEQVRLFFAGDNLITFTKYPGLDPERGGSGSFVQYPQNKIYSFGLNVKF